jgi:BTB/POZ domain
MVNPIIFKSTILYKEKNHKIFGYVRAAPRLSSKWLNCGTRLHIIFNCQADYQSLATNQFTNPHFKSSFKRVKTRFYFEFRMFCDVDILCGVDGGVVRTHRLFLSGLSQFFCQVFLSDSSDVKEETLVLLPDVDSSKLLFFAKVIFSSKFINREQSVTGRLCVWRGGELQYRSV